MKEENGLFDSDKVYNIKQLQSTINVSYKTAYKIAKQLDEEGSSNTLIPNAVRKHRLFKGSVLNEFFSRKPEYTNPDKIGNNSN